MVALDPEWVKELARGVIDPHNGAPLGDAVSGVFVREGKVAIDLVLGYPSGSTQSKLAGLLATQLTQHPGIEAVSVDISHSIASFEVQGGLAPLAGVKNIVAVASGKGGVGKSTVAVNLALALKGLGARVGILDADIYGPSLPRMLGLSEPPKTPREGVIEPLDALGLQAMSIGVLVDSQQAMIWRGPMATQALQQMLRQTAWHNLDYLILDLPPGTGDIQLTLAQRIPVAGVVLVTTPQALALDDVRRAAAMFGKVNIPILGLVENMSTYVCPKCGDEEAIFGEGGGALLCEEMSLSMLGRVPIDPNLGRSADSGSLAIGSSPTDVLAERFRDIALGVGARLARQAHNRQVRMPRIKIVD